MMIIDGNSAKILKEKFKDQIKRNVEIKAFLEEKEKISGGNKFLEEFLEAWAFIDTIIQVSKDESLLSENSKKKLKDLKEKREIITFVTPICPYCPYQVFLSNNLVIEAKGIITSICIDALEFPELADKFEVSSVPHNVINGKTSSIGVQPEEKFVEDVIKGG
ncbi:MAG: thioredoxin family protein [Candidatus Aenigmatarchaeota archaeon]